jgi:hypothetical protein
MQMLRRIIGSWKASVGMFLSRKSLGLLVLATVRGLGSIFAHWAMLIASAGLVSIAIATMVGRGYPSWLVTVLVDGSLCFYMYFLILAVRPSVGRKDTLYFAASLKRLLSFLVVRMVHYFVWLGVMFWFLPRLITALHGVTVLGLELDFGLRSNALLLYMAVMLALSFAVHFYTFFLLFDLPNSWRSIWRSLVGGLRFVLVNLPGIALVTVLCMAIFAVDAFLLWQFMPGLYALHYSFVLTLPFIVAIQGAVYTRRLYETMGLVGLGN